MKFILALSLVVTLGVADCYWTWVVDINGDYVEVYICDGE